MLFCRAGRERTTEQAEFHEYDGKRGLLDSLAANRFPKAGRRRKQSNETSTRIFSTNRMPLSCPLETAMRPADSRPGASSLVS
jgi:hypothetical protein